MYFNRHENPRRCGGRILQAGVLSGGNALWSESRGDLVPCGDEWESVLLVCRSAAVERATRRLEPFFLNGRECVLAVHPFPPGGGVDAIILFLDMSGPEACLRSQRQLADKFMELEAVVSGTSDGIWVCDALGVVTLVNPAAERVNNISADDVVGKSMYSLVENGFIDRSAALEVIRTGSPASLLQQRGGRKLTSTGTPVFTPDGTLHRVVVSTQDATEVDNLRRELERQELLTDNYRYQLQKLQDQFSADREIIARSPNMLAVLRQAAKAGDSDATILLLGESGTGKGLLTELIHNRSRSREHPLLAVNCGAFPESLVESELFGYEKGAFTGARTSKPGLFEVADNGTLFLDEVGELPLQTQVKLLKFLDDGKITRLGGTKARKVDVRVIAATNQDLKAMVAEGTFREDLYYRLNIIPIRIPPLRERQECIPVLLSHFINYFGTKYNTPKRLRSAALDTLTAYDYPGNVRQLINICERLVVMTEHDVIDRDDLMGEVLAGREYISFKSLQESNTSLREALQTLEKSLLLEAYERCDRQKEIAKALDISQASVARKLKAYGIGHGAGRSAG